MAAIVKFLLCTLVAFLALIPLWLWLWIKSALNPEGFWQNFIVFGAGIYLLGGLQIVFLIFGFVVIMAIINE